MNEDKFTMKRGRASMHVAPILWQSASDYLSTVGIIAEELGHDRVIFETEADVGYIIFSEPFHELDEDEVRERARSAAFLTRIVRILERYEVEESTYDYLTAYPAVGPSLKISMLRSDD